MPDVLKAPGSAGAILLSLVSEEDAAILVGALDPGEISSLCSAMETINTVASGDIEAVLTAFIERARTINPVAERGGSAVRAAIERSLGSPRARAFLQRSQIAQPHPVAERLSWLAVDHIRALVERENPQVAAIVLAAMPTEASAGVLGRLEAGLRADLVARMAQAQPVGEEALDELLDVVRALEGVDRAASIAVGGVKPVADILNRLEGTEADAALKALARQNKSLAAAIDGQRVVFSDVVGLADKDLGAVVRATDAGLLALALQEIDEQTRDRFLSAMSSRSAESLRDLMDETKNAKLVDIEAARAELIGNARRLADEQAITFRRGGSARRNA